MEEENLRQEAAPDSGETQESSCKADNNNRARKTDEKMGITQLKNYHPVTGTVQCFLCHLSLSHLLLIITFRYWAFLRYNCGFSSFIEEKIGLC